MAGRVTLLTDFGTRDGYVGALKGVISAAVPGVLIDDISHDLAHGDVSSGAYALARYWRLYGEGTVHLAVVDPGVGTSRRGAAFEVEGRFVVTPDNGIVSRILDQATRWSAVELAAVETPRSVTSGRSSTFHGRDVFAPAAAHLAGGGALGALGPALRDPVRLGEPSPVRDASGADGVVVAVDRFGNLLTNLPGDWLRGSACVEVGGARVPIRSTYGSVEPRELVALTSSDGRVEVAVRDGSAAERLRAGPGTWVRIRPR